MQLMQDLPPEIDIYSSTAEGEGNGKFVCQHQKLLLTYKTHLNKKNYIKWINDVKKKATTFIRLAHESGKGDPITPYKHTHIVIHFRDKFYTRDCRYFDLDILVDGERQTIHPHIRKIKQGELNWKRVLGYIGKEDPENEDLRVATTPLAATVWSKNTVQEVLYDCVSKPSDVPGLLALYNAKPKEEFQTIIEEHERRPWMKIFENIMETAPSRKVHWLYDTTGNAYKSKYAAYIEDHDKGWLAISSVGSVRDFAMNIDTALKQGWTSQGLIIDAPRRMHDKDYIYQTLELCLNGRVTCTKYTGGKVKFRPPHVWVFANFLPMIEDSHGELTLSKDRWDIYAIEPQLTDVDIEELTISSMTLGKPIEECQTKWQERVTDWSNNNKVHVTIVPVL